jgi:hypothetical protein
MTNADLIAFTKFMFDRYAAGSMPTDRQIELAIGDFNGSN